MEIGIIEDCLSCKVSETLRQDLLSVFDYFLKAQSLEKEIIMSKALLDYGMMSEIKSGGNRIFLPKAECIAYAVMYRYYVADLPFLRHDADSMLGKIYQEAMKFAFSHQVDFHPPSKLNGKPQ